MRWLLGFDFTGRISVLHSHVPESPLEYFVRSTSNGKLNQPLTKPSRLGGTLPIRNIEKWFRDPTRKLMERSLTIHKIENTGSGKLRAPSRDRIIVEIRLLINS
jgi:hypothetical protein